MQTNTKYLLTMVFTTIIFITLSCEKDLSVTGDVYQPIDKSTVTLTPETAFNRQIYYDKDALVRANADTNDFKAAYTFKELSGILADSAFARQVHKSLPVDDDCYYYNIYEILHNCDDLVLGYVLKVECRQDVPDDMSTVNTFVTLQNIKSCKNLITSELITIKDFGGQIGDSVTDMLNFPRPQFAEKELALVALKKQGNVYRTWGRNQGKFNYELKITN